MDSGNDKQNSVRRSFRGSSPDRLFISISVPFRSSFKDFPPGFRRPAILPNPTLTLWIANHRFLRSVGRHILILWPGILALDKLVDKVVECLNLTTCHIASAPRTTHLPGLLRPWFFWAKQRFCSSGGLYVSRLPKTFSGFQSATP